MVGLGHGSTNDTLTLLTILQAQAQVRPRLSYVPLCTLAHPSSCSVELTVVSRLPSHPHRPHPRLPRYDDLLAALDHLTATRHLSLACTACRKRDCGEICPTGTAKPPGRAVRIAAEFSALLRRVEQLESTIRDLGAEDQIPPALNLEEATKRSTTVTKALEAEIAQPRQQWSQGYEEQGSDGEDGGEQASTDAAVESVLVGVGSLSIADSGRTRFLGTSAGSAYYYDVRLCPSSRLKTTCLEAGCSSSSPRAATGERRAGRQRPQLARR